MNTIEKFNSHVMGTYGRYPVVLNKGSGCHAIDENGREYIDFGSGIGTNSLGYCNQKWTDAVCAQVHRLQHNSNYYYTSIQAEFAERLCEISGYQKVFFGNSGAEANECAIKLARKYSFDKYGLGRHNIITLQNSFHGRTLCTLSATGQDTFHNYFFPFVDGFPNALPNDIQSLESMLDDTICAVMIEFIQGEGGVIALDKDYVHQLFDLCSEKDILIIADEVQSGVGRTGKFLSSEHYGVYPDITTLAKGLAGGLPIGACLANLKCADVLSAGTHGSTFGGNPISCAGGIAVLETVSAEGFLDSVAEKSEWLKSKLLALDEVESVSGIGLMLGITLKTKSASDVVKAAHDLGLLLLTAKNKVRLLPPLNISYEDLEKGLAILRNLL